jgi:hypothetical protein
MQRLSWRRGIILDELLLAAYVKNEGVEMAEDPIIMVSGLPRSGTSMMMKMLEAGGLEILTDNIRTADEDNPKGYYEFEKAKELDKDRSWLDQAKGKVVKIISALLSKIPQENSCKIIFMRRKMSEILASQKEMLIRRGEPTDTVSDEKISQNFFAHLRKVEAWLEQQPNFDILYINYNDVLKNPLANIERIRGFLGNGLDTRGMAGVVDKALYRQRK